MNFLYFFSFLEFAYFLIITWHIYQSLIIPTNNVNIITRKHKFVTNNNYLTEQITMPT